MTNFLMKPSNDNVASPRAKRQECFALRELVSTRRRLKVKEQFLREGSLGQILRIRAPGRLYDVIFSSSERLIMTLSHCDIKRLGVSA
jgi:hypothetical protein